jgi:hypothetical protein
MQQSMLSQVDITYAANKQRLVPLDHPLLGVARAVRTCFGE